jgi:hypothetical protein
MNRIFTAAALALALSAPAQAVEWNSTGQWLDTRRHIVADDAHLGYAKAICHAREGTWTGGPTGPGYGPCMKSQGFAFVVDTPAQTAARERAEQSERNIAAAHAVGQALIGIANDLNRPQPQPQHCNGFIYRGGDINMNCN